MGYYGYLKKESIPSFSLNLLDKHHFKNESKHEHLLEISIDLPDEL